MNLLWGIALATAVGGCALAPAAPEPAGPSPAPVAEHMRENAEVAALQDIGQREFWMLAILAAAVLLLGLWPQPLTDVMEVSIKHLLDQVLQSKLCSGLAGGCP